MNKLNEKLSFFKYKLWLVAVWILKILFAKSDLKVPFIKRLYFNIFGGFTKNQVALYNLNKQNKDEYLSEFDWYKSRRINYPNSYMLNNKLICNELLQGLVSLPKTLAIKENGVIKIDDQISDMFRLLSLIKEEKSVFLKPVSQGKGIGVFRIDYKENDFFIDFEKITENDLITILEEKNKYFISSCIKQDAYLDAIYDKTSNTIRLITINDNDETKIAFAVQRIGTKETIPVDNGSRGGLVAKIDLVTGKLSSARSIKNKNEYKVHPDSNNAVEGIIIPNWENIKNEMLNLSERLPQFKLIAWDILPSNDGLYVIEANASSGVNILQLWGGLRNKDLGNFYKKEKIIKRRDGNV